MKKIKETKAAPWRLFISGVLFSVLAVGATCENQGVSARAPLGAGTKVTQVSAPEPDRVAVSVSGRVDSYAFVLSEDPFRIALDLRDAELAPEVAASVSGRGIVESVEVVALSDLDPPVVRVIANLSQPATFKTERKADGVSLALEPMKADRSASDFIAYEDSPKTARPAARAMPAGDFTPPFLPVMPSANPDGSASAVGEIFFRFLEDGTVQVMIYANGPVRDFVDFDLLGPPRLVVDLWGVSPVTPKKNYGVDYGAVKRVRIGDHGDKTRVVIECRGPLPAYEVQRIANGLVVTVFKMKNVQGGANYKVRVSGVGESLRSIALEEYGNGDCWPRLLSANRRHFTSEELRMMHNTDGAVEIGEGLEIRVPVR